jgi:hypothetical protein
MAIGRTLIVSKEQIVKIIIPVILLLSIISNLQTIDYYLNPSHAEKFYYMAEFILTNTSKRDSIFGEPVMTNYISFITGRRISSDYLDSYPQHLAFEKEEKVVQDLEKDRPKFIIDMENYYLVNPFFNGYIQEKYELKLKIQGTPNYFVYEIK